MASGNFGNGGDDFTPMTEMNMVPFIDVMLVLLIISMVTTPFLEQGVNVDLPVAGGKTLQAGQETSIVIYYSKDGNLRVGDTPVSRADLVRTLKQKFEGRRDKGVVLHGDKGVSYGSIVEIMAMVQGAGIEQLGLVTQAE